MMKVEIACTYALNVKMYIAFEANWGAVLMIHVKDQ